MSKNNGRDYLYLIWKDPVSRKQYTVGKLSKNGMYEFEYGFEFDEAKKAGFSQLIPFPDETKKYNHETLFQTFASRLPDPKRKDILAILQRYGLQEYDAYELLKKSGGKLPIDNLEFIDPIFSDEINFTRTFFLAGSRYYLSCKGEDCIGSEDIRAGDMLVLIPEPDNLHDKSAVFVKIGTGVKIGYIPRYYSKEVTGLIQKNLSLTCTVLEQPKEKRCSECIKVMLKCTEK